MSHHWIMARKKAYDEQEVLEKALGLFWRNGYETTSTRMLEKEMGINQFSIYSSFGNKQGVYIACLKLYKQRIKTIVSKLDQSAVPVEGIKTYFYDFIEFSKDESLSRGCLLTNAMTELDSSQNSDIQTEVQSFIDYLTDLFAKNLSLDVSKTNAQIQEQANYLIVALAGLSLASKSFDQERITNYIEHTFRTL